MNIDRQLEINEGRRERANDRYSDKLDKAHALVGELCREGKTIYYVTKMTKRGLKVVEGDYSTVLDYAMRNLV
jgi:hypothetical protein